MAINLNDSMYGAQFSVFRELASQANLTQDTLVSVDEAGRGKGLLNQNGERRTIVVKNGDTIRPLFGRSQGHKDLNNEVRNLFKETVLRVCGAKTLEDLPKAVLDVMKKDDYDNEGHPLSLRRIRAVTEAIVNEATLETVNRPVEAKKAEIIEEPKPVDHVPVDPVPVDGSVIPQDVQAKVDAYREEHGDLVADTVLETVKSMKGQVSAEDIEVLDADELDKLKECAAWLDISGIAKTVTDADAYSATVDAFKKQVSDNLNALYPNGTGSPAMTAIKKNLVIRYAVARMPKLSKFKVETALRYHYDLMVEKFNHRDLLDLMLPALKSKGAFTGGA